MDLPADITSRNWRITKASTMVHKAIHPEKEIKGRVRQKRIELIEGVNPRWKDSSTRWYNRR